MLVNGVLYILKVGPQAVQVQIYLHKLWKSLAACFLHGMILTSVLVLCLSILGCLLRLWAYRLSLLGLFISKLMTHILGARSRQTRGATSASIVRSNVLRSRMLRWLLRFIFFTENTAVILSASCSSNSDSSSHKLRIDNPPLFSCIGCWSRINFQIKGIFEFLTIFLSLLFQTCFYILGSPLRCWLPHTTSSDCSWLLLKRWSWRFT